MIESLIGLARYFSARADDDVVDRMNYLYTPNILLAFSVLISFKQFGGRPLECLLPAKFPGSWEQVRLNWSGKMGFKPFPVLRLVTPTMNCFSTRKITAGRKTRTSCHRTCTLRRWHKKSATRRNANSPTTNGFLSSCCCKPPASAHRVSSGSASASTQVPHVFGQSFRKTLQESEFMT